MKSSYTGTMWGHRLIDREGLGLGLTGAYREGR